MTTDPATHEYRDSWDVGTFVRLWTAWAAIFPAAADPPSGSGREPRTA